MEAGIKPAYVFDGKPPDFKKRELEKRREARKKQRRSGTRPLRRVTLRRPRSTRCAPRG